MKVADAVGLKDKRDQTADMLLRLYDLFVKKDALLIEVNPYAEDSAGNCEFIYEKVVFGSKMDIEFLGEYLF